MRSEPNFGKFQDIEAMLRADRQSDPPGDTHIAMAELAPIIAKEAARLRRKRKNRREGMVMLGASAIAVILLMLGGAAYYLGNISLVKGMAACVGILSVMALLTLPLIEKFLPEKG